MMVDRTDPAAGREAARLVTDPTGFPGVPWLPVDGSCARFLEAPEPALRSIANRAKLLARQLGAGVPRRVARHDERAVRGH